MVGMNTEESALLRAVLLDPEDDTPRLVYADWLEEHGQGDRSHLIQMQCDGRKVPLAVSDFRRWFKPWWGNGTPFSVSAAKGRCRAVVRDAVGFGGGVRRAPPPSIGVRRGFTEELVMPCGDFMRMADFLFQRHPIKQVVLTDREPAASFLHPDGFRWWFATDEDNGAAVAVLGADLYLVLDKMFRGANSQSEDSPYFPTREAAIDALSAACVAYGRSLAGLPPLTHSRGAVTEPRRTTTHPSHSP